MADYRQLLTILKPVGKVCLMDVSVNVPCLPLRIHISTTTCSTRSEVPVTATTEWLPLHIDMRL